MKIVGGDPLNTKDQVFLYSYDEIRNLTPKEKVSYATDYAIMCGATLCCEQIGYKNKSTTYKACRSGAGFGMFDCVSYIGDHGRVDIDNKQFAISPVLNLNLDHFFSTQSAARIQENKKGGYHTVTIGLEFPKSYVGKKLDKELTLLKDNGQLKKTGAKFTGFMRKDGSLVQNEEYEFNGEKYVLVEVLEMEGWDRELENGTDCSKIGKYAWTKVEPIPFRIRNWDAMPGNPKGNYTAKFVEVEAEEGIIAGLPFYTDGPVEVEEEMEMWQNSFLRAWLNGYNIYKEIYRGNGNRGWKAPKNFNFEGKGFLFEATHGLGVQMDVKDIGIGPKTELKQDDEYSL